MVPNSLIMVSWVVVLSLILSIVAPCWNSITPWGLLLAAMVMVAMVLVSLSNACPVGETSVLMVRTAVSVRVYRSDSSGIRSSTTTNVMFASEDRCVGGSKERGCGKRGNW